ncbi:translation initiation factor IF-2 [Equus asinus]|uniref:translation initiation factor IF-2 n=1 Tax=Equus asinus TaxID=9793 RepID=UPI0038F6F164
MRANGGQYAPPLKTILFEQTSRCPRPGRASLLPRRLSPPTRPRRGTGDALGPGGAPRSPEPRSAGTSRPRRAAPEPPPSPATRPRARASPDAGRPGSRGPLGAPPPRSSLSPAPRAARRGLLLVPGPPDPRVRPHSLRGGSCGGPAGRRRRPESASARTSEPAPGGGGGGGRRDD